ncbi:MAG: toxin-antitoxin system YwqK family antitoxin [Lewinella sp.]
MKFIISILVLLGALTVSCAEKGEQTPIRTSIPVDTLVEIPNLLVDISLLNYDNKTSRWTLDEALFSGYAVSWHEDSTLATKAGIYKGRKHGQASRWHLDGHLRQVANYRQGKLHGAKKTWSSDADHFLIAHLNYRKGKVHGEQRKWYPTGELYKVLNLNMGKEEGMQQAFRKTGELYANYEAKNGRIFGLKKASLCYGLEDENMKNGK